MAWIALFVGAVREQLQRHDGVDRRLPHDALGAVLAHRRRVVHDVVGDLDAVPHDVIAEPLLNLNSGYIQRAKDRMPQQGSRPPWQV